VVVSTPANFRVCLNLSVASDADRASPVRPPIPMAAPMARIGPMAERTAPENALRAPPLLLTESSAASAARSRSSMPSAALPALAPALVASEECLPSATASASVALSAALVLTSRLPRALE